MKHLFYSLIIADLLLACSISTAVTVRLGTHSETVHAKQIHEAHPHTERPAHHRQEIPVTAAAYHPVQWWDEGFRAVQHDRTDEHAYIVGEYGCEQFSLDLVTNLRSFGIYAYRVAVKFNGSDYGHMFVAVPTTDLGVIYVEPQDDFLLEPPRVGQQFCYNLSVYNDPPACNPSLIITKVTEYP